VLLVSYLRSHCRIQIHKDVLLCSLLRVSKLWLLNLALWSILSYFLVNTERKNFLNQLSSSFSIRIFFFTGVQLFYSCLTNSCCIKWGCTNIFSWLTFSKYGSNNIWWPWVLGRGWGDISEEKKKCPKVNSCCSMSVLIGEEMIMTAYYCHLLLGEVQTIDSPRS
jgi:hypothetical protein